MREQLENENIELRNENLELKNEMQKLEEIVSKNSINLSEYMRVLDSAQMIIKYDKSIKIVSINDLFCKTTGYKREDIYGKKMEYLIHPNESSQKIKELKNAIKSKEIWRGRLEYKRKNGEMMFVDSIVVPLFDSNDEIIEHVEILRDITDIIRQEQELEELRYSEMKENITKAKEIKNEMLLDAIPLPAFICKQNGKIKRTNSQFVAMFDAESIFEIVGCVDKDEQKNMLEKLSIFDGENHFVHPETQERLKLNAKIIDIKKGLFLVVVS